MCPGWTMSKQPWQCTMNDWELAKQLKQEARSSRTPKSLDVKSFYKYALGGKSPGSNAPGQFNIWPLIKSINLELVLFVAGLGECGVGSAHRGRSAQALEQFAPQGRTCPRSEQAG